MGTDRRGIAFCTTTGLAVPECSCRECLETMLVNFRPELLSEEIRITRSGPAAGPRGERPDLRSDPQGS